MALETSQLPYTFRLLLSVVCLCYLLFSKALRWGKRKLWISLYTASVLHAFPGSWFVCKAIMLDSDRKWALRSYQPVSHSFGIDAKLWYWYGVCSSLSGPVQHPLQASKRGFLLHGTEDGGGQSLRAFYLPLPAVLAASRLWSREAF